MSTLEVQIADHRARIKNLEEKEKDTSSKLDHLRNLIIGTLAAAVGGLLTQLLKH